MVRRRPVGGFGRLERSQGGHRDGWRSTSTTPCSGGGGGGQRPPPCSDFCTCPDHDAWARGRRGGLDHSVAARARQQRAGVTTAHGRGGGESGLDHGAFARRVGGISGRDHGAWARGRRGDRDHSVAARGRRQRVAATIAHVGFDYAPVHGRYRWPRLRTGAREVGWGGRHTIIAHGTTSGAQLPGALPHTHTRTCTLGGALAQA